MKGVLFWIFKLALVMCVLTLNAYDAVNKGVVNILVLFAWIEAAFLLLSALSCFSADEFEKLVQKTKPGDKYTWTTVINRFCSWLIGFLFVFCGFWFTGIAFLIGSAALHLVIELANDKAKETR